MIKLKTSLHKKRCWGIMGTLPFTHIPQKLIIGLVQIETMWLNAFSSNTGISKMWRLLELICRHKLDATKHCNAQFGSYCEVHDETDPSNSMKPPIHSLLLPWDQLNICKGHMNSYAWKQEKILKISIDRLKPESVIDTVNQMEKGVGHLMTDIVDDRKCVIESAKDDEISKWTRTWQHT